MAVQVPANPSAFMIIPPAHPMRFPKNRVAFISILEYTYKRIKGGVSA
jgi:hypothetical protein